MKKKFINIFKKKSPFEKFMDNNHEFISYVAISLLCTAIFFVLYLLITYITNGSYLIANTISYVVSFTLLYLLDQMLFKAKNKSKKKKYAQLIAFVIVRIVGFPLDSYILYLFVDKFGMSNIMGKLFDSLIMFCYNYITNKLFVFKIKD